MPDILGAEISCSSKSKLSNSSRKVGNRNRGLLTGPKYGGDLSPRTATVTVKVLARFLKMSNQVLVGETGLVRRGEANRPSGVYLKCTEVARSTFDPGNRLPRDVKCFV